MIGVAVEGPSRSGPSLIKIETLVGCWRFETKIHETTEDASRSKEDTRLSEYTQEIKKRPVKEGEQG